MSLNLRKKADEFDSAPEQEGMIQDPNLISTQECQQRIDKVIETMKDQNQWDIRQALQSQLGRLNRAILHSLEEISLSINGGSMPNLSIANGHINNIKRALEQERMKIE